MGKLEVYVMMFLEIGVLMIFVGSYEFCVYVEVKLIGVLCLFVMIVVFCELI